MPLSAGEILGPYELLSPIGEGGMGEVWKARDTRLDRIVAVKVSKAQFSDRFQREARAIAALNHPNICTLYDVGPNYLVMEFIEGSPLTGPLVLPKVVEYAGQILDALDAAHRNGITHRRPDARELLAQRPVRGLHFERIRKIRSVCPNIPADRAEVAGFNSRGNGATVAKGRTGDLLPCSGPEADGGSRLGGSGVRRAPGAVPDAGSRTKLRLPDTLCSGGQRATVSDQYPKRRRERQPDHRDAELDRRVEKVIYLNSDRSIDSPIAL